MSITNHAFLIESKALICSSILFAFQIEFSLAILVETIILRVCKLCKEKHISLKYEVILFFTTTCTRTKKKRRIHRICNKYFIDLPRIMLCTSTCQLV